MNKFINNSNFEESNIVVVGVSFNNKADIMLENLRKLNWFVESFDIEKKKDLLEKTKVSDIGNFELKDLTTKVKSIVSNKKIPLIFGANHQLSFYSLKALEKAKVIIFDAHGDIKDSFMDKKVAESVDGLNLNEKEKLKFNSTTWLRRYCELENPKNVMIIGLRSCGEEDFKYIKENGISYFTPSQIRKNIKAVEKKIKEFVKDSDIYVSLDIDVFDPSIAPAVTHPESNGLTFYEFSELIKEISNGKLVGADLVEIKPIEGNEITEFLAIRSIFELLYYIK